jgi:hypothetical protein
MVERAHRQIKDALRARLAGVEWPQHLPWVLLGLRSAPKEDAAMSSAELVFGAALTLFFFFDPIFFLLIRKSIGGFYNT